MAHGTKLAGTDYAVTGGQCRVDGVGYAVTGGKTRVAGTAYDIPFEDYQPVLGDNSWSAISRASRAGIAASLWSVGDTKAVELSGTVQRLPLPDTLWVYILGFDHNLAVEGSGIQFGCFLSAETGGVELCLVDDRYGTENQGEGYESMNFFSSMDDPLPWYQSRMRLEVLGSSDVPQAQATAATVTSPAPGTLMAALPAELRAVMQPITKYSDNGGPFMALENVTATVEYLPLPSEREVLGRMRYGNQAEWQHVEQYEFYKLGLSDQRCRADDRQTPVHFWTRSASIVQEHYFVQFSDNTTDNHQPGTASLGIAPVFKV